MHIPWEGMVMSPAVRLVCSIVVAGSLVLLQACAPSVVRQQTAALQPAQSPIRVKLVDEIEAHIGTGYPARLKAGTTWQLVGSIPESDVYYEVSTATETEKKLTFTLAENETRYVRLEIGFGILVGRVYGVLVEQDEAAKELSSMHYTGVVTN
jgi:hypothetical protein